MAILSIRLRDLTGAGDEFEETGWRLRLVDTEKRDGIATSDGLLGVTVELDGEFDGEGNATVEDLSDSPAGTYYLLQVAGIGSWPLLVSGDSTAAAAYAAYLNADISLRGPTGPQGPQGVQGPTGPTGPAGAQGVQGDPGPTGPAGPQGDPGVMGARGPQGDAGPQGEQGEPGVTGARGPDGAQGPRGDTGATGPQGAQGLTGDTGPTGPQGARGDIGPRGVQGPQGERGDTGAQGAAGAKGDRGDTGPAGPQGPQGEQGERGTTGQSSHWYERSGPPSGWEFVGVTLNDSDFCLRTDGGDVYEYGNGQWTRVGNLGGAQGPTGPTGPTGPQGPQGDPGPTGAQGPQGDPGATGPQGARGATGATGATGSQGPRGATGAQGPQGDPGATGPQGAQGAQGDRGPQGFRGGRLASIYRTSSTALTARPTGGTYVPNGDNLATIPSGWGRHPVSPVTSADRIYISQAVLTPSGSGTTVTPTWSTPAVWSGDTGATGPQGARGATGATGARGAQGPAATPTPLNAVIIGSSVAIDDTRWTTVAAMADLPDLFLAIASVTVSGTTSETTELVLKTDLAGQSTHVITLYIARNTRAMTLRQRNNNLQARLDDDSGNIRVFSVSGAGTGAGGTSVSVHTPAADDAELSGLDIDGTDYEIVDAESRARLTGDESRITHLDSLTGDLRLPSSSGTWALVNSDGSEGGIAQTSGFPTLTAAAAAGSYGQRLAETDASGRHFAVRVPTGSDPASWRVVFTLGSNSYRPLLSTFDSLGTSGSWDYYRPPNASTVVAALALETNEMSVSGRTEYVGNLAEVKVWDQLDTILAGSGIGLTKAASPDPRITIGPISDRTVSTGKIVDGAVTAAKIANNAVTTGKIADNAVTTGKINNAAVTSPKIADNAVTVAKLPSGASAGEYLDGDGTWKMLPSGESTVTAHTPTAGDTELSGIDIDGTDYEIVDAENRARAQSNASELAGVVARVDAEEAHVGWRVSDISRIGDPPSDQFHTVRDSRFARFTYAVQQATVPWDVSTMRWHTGQASRPSSGWGGSGTAIHFLVEVPSNGFPGPDSIRIANGRNNSLVYGMLADALTTTGNSPQVANARPGYSYYSTGRVAFQSLDPDFTLEALGGSSGGHTIYNGLLSQRSIGDALFVDDPFEGGSVGKLVGFSSDGGKFLPVDPPAAAGGNGSLEYVQVGSEVGLTSAAQNIAVYDDVADWFLLEVEYLDDRASSNRQSMTGTVRKSDISGNYRFQVQGLGSSAVILTTAGSGATRMLRAATDFASNYTSGTIKVFNPSAQGAKGDKGDPGSLSGGGVDHIRAVTQTAYDAITTPDAATLYIITGA